MTRGREQLDGSIIFPKRGSPPPDQVGYLRDPGDAFRLLPIWPECEHRTQGVSVSSCCPDEKVIFYGCLKGYKVTYQECTGCVASGRNNGNEGKSG